MTAYLVTGGTGSLGTQLIGDLLADPDVERVCSLSRDEVKAGALTERYGASDKLRVFLGDVRDFPRLLQAFHGVDVVIHTAALKRVTESVYSPGELIQTNITGTINVINAAIATRVKKVLLVSSDKAVSPLNLYGMTKGVAEAYAIQANSYAWPQGTAIACVRYGNVLGSRGSVLQTWIHQASEGKPLRLTHGEMTRFVWTIDEAAHFVRWAARGMHGGEILIPLMWSVRMDMLAKVVVKAYGPASILVSGLRPGGEKIHEDLLSPDETGRAFQWIDPTIPDGMVYLVAPSYQTWSAATWSRERMTRVPESMVYRSDRRIQGWEFTDAIMRRALNDVR